MGQSKTGGYQKLDATTPEVATLLQQLLGQSQGNQQAAAEGFKQFLPGGGGGAAITQQANKNFQQQTLPSILAAYGGDNKGSSALNQALAAGASNLNTDLASHLAKMQQSAAQGLGGIGGQQSQIATQTPQFAYQPKQLPFWQQAILAGGNAAGKAGAAYLGAG